MLKKNYHKILLTAILIVTVLSMLGMAVAAAVVNNYTVTFHYNKDLCSTFVFKVDGVLQQPVSQEATDPQNPQDVQVVYLVNGQHRAVTLEIVPATGYAVSSLKSQIQVGEGNQQILDCDMNVNSEKNIYSYSAALDSVVTDFFISFSAREYTIQVEPARVNGDKLNHQWPEGTTTNPSGTTYVYSTDENEYISLSIPVLSGYTFNGWMILPSADAQTGTLLPYKPGEDHVKLYKNTVPKVGATLYLMPDWNPEEYDVYRQDREYDTYLLLSKDEHGISWKAETGTLVDGSMGENVTYPGYYPFADKYATSTYFSNEISVQAPGSGNPYRNTVTRYYVPITYTLIYKGFEDDKAALDAFEAMEGYSATHVYNTTTQIPQPQRTGYTFAGWQVFVGDKNITKQINAEVTSAIKQLKLDSRQTYFAEGNTTNEITLVATWTPKTYNIQYDWNGVDSSALTFDQSAYTKYVYDTALTIPVPIRKGYTLVGWDLVSGSVSQRLTPVDGKIVLDAKTYADDITLKAIWQANSYTVTLDGNGALLSINPFTATFDKLLTLPADFVLPSYKGHTFLGFFTKDGDTWGSVAWIDAEGKVNEKVWDIDADTVLYAKWSVNSYQVSVSVQDKTNTALDSDRFTVSVTDVNTGVSYDYLNEKIAYGTVLRIRIELAANFDYKLVAWNGEACGHTVVGEFIYTVDAQDCVLIAKALPVIAAPNYTLDYTNEVLTFDRGNYQIVCNGVTLEITDVLTLRDDFFGQTLQITVLGASGETANREMTIVLAARPDVPVLDDRDGIDEGEHIAEIMPTESSIVIKMIKTALEKYDFLYFCSVSDIVVSKDQWKLLTPDENGRFTIEGLSPGTYYYVYICIKAKDDAYPQGYVFKHRLDTEAESFVENTKQSLLDKINQGTDGAYVQSVIDQAIADIDRLSYPSTTFGDEVQEILNRVAAQLPVARAKDVNIAALMALYEELLATKSFDEQGIISLTTIRDNAIAQIRSDAANTEAKVLSTTIEATVAMKDIRVTYLYTESDMLTFQAGLPQGTQLILTPYGSYAHLIDRINDAIRYGMIASDGTGISLEALQTLDLMGYYQLKLSDGEKTLVAPDGVYEIRLLIPEALRGNQGLQVAYFNEKTGMLTILDTEIDGNTLVFHSNKSGITDFVILGDTTVVMTSFIAALGITFLCQLIAIVVLIACRMKSRKKAMMEKRYSLMLPIALTIRFLPENSMLLLVVLGTLVAIAQIVLMYLIFTSDFAHRSIIRKRGYRHAVLAHDEKKAEDLSENESYEEAVASFETLDAADGAPVPNDDEMQTFIPVDDEAIESLFEDDLEESVEEYGEDGAYYAYEDTDTLTEDETEVEDEEALGNLLEDTATVDDNATFTIDDERYYEDFIEPAPNPNYSLPSDDEDLYVDTVTGEIYSADELNENDVILDDLEESKQDAEETQSERIDDESIEGYEL